MLTGEVVFLYKKQKEFSIFAKIDLHHLYLIILTAFELKSFEFLKIKTEEFVKLDR